MRHAASAPTQGRIVGSAPPMRRDRRPIPPAIGEACTWLIDDPAGACGMLERKDRAVRQQADRQAAAIGDLLEAEFVDVRRREDRRRRAGDRLVSFAG